MDAFKLDRLFSEQWRSLVIFSCEALERDDLRQVTTYSSFEDVQAELMKAQDDPISPLSQAASQELAMLTPNLLQLKIFTDFLSTELGPQLDVSIIWGLVVLVTKIAEDEEGAHPRVPRMLRDICHRLELFNKYFGRSSNLIAQMKEATFDIGSGLLRFLSFAVKFLRGDTEQTSWTDIGPKGDTWFPLTQKSKETLQEIDESLNRIERLEKFETRADTKFAQLSITEFQESKPPDESAKIPCIMLPNSRTSRLFNRTDLIESIAEYFYRSPNGENEFRSIALWGLGGVGKSSVAMKYTEGQIRNGKYDAVFWIHGEKLASMRQSFTDIAIRLVLPGVKSSDHDENRTLVLRWLQQTQCRWLLVYDNVESLDLLLEHWPNASRGHVLLTTRNHSFAFEPAGTGLEVHSWDADTGSQFLVHLLSTNIGAELTAAETKSAHDLSKQLSGHALAISHMAGLMHRRSWSISEFIKMYQKYPSKMHGMSGNSSINALWQISFEQLDQDSATLLGVLSFLMPDSIPQDLFEPDPSNELPESLSFCEDEFGFSEALESLLTLSLVRKDKASRTLSLHRLVQTSYKHFMTPEQRQKAFTEAATLVSFAFPKEKDSATAQLYLMWDRCALYLQHVLSLRDFFREERKSSKKFAAPLCFCETNNDCERYLVEINSYGDLQDLIAVNLLAVDTLPAAEKGSRMPGCLASYAGQMFIRIGKPKEGLQKLIESYELHCIADTQSYRAWAAENAANAFATLNDFENADQWHAKAREHWRNWTNECGTDPKQWPAVLKKSWSTALIWAGEFERARELALQAIQQIESSELLNWANAAYTNFALGTLERRQGNLNAAESYFIKAQNAWVEGDHMRTDPFNAACMYRIGCVSYEQGRIEAALKHLREAVIVTDMRKQAMLIEHVRGVAMLAKVLHQTPRGKEEGEKLAAEAKALFKKRAPDIQDDGRQETYDSLVNILWR